MPENLGDLYKEVILAHNKAPLNYGKREDAAHVVDAYNPVCGDHFQLYFDLEEGVIRNLSFHGYGCAISKASTSILTKLLEGKTLDEVEKAERLLQKILQGDADPAHDPKELLAFEPVRDHPARLKCVTLSWDTLKELLSEIR